MSCSCIINDNFNFVIEYKKDHLLFIDKSEWTTPEFNTPIKEHPLTIINDNKEKTINIRINGITIIRYCDLPSDNGCGNDGIYTFKLESCGDIFYRTEAILIHIMCSYSKLLIKYKPEDYRDIVYPIFREIELIKANAIMGLDTKAQEHYKIVKKMFEHLNCKC